jgi:hypothetical protein
MSLPVSQQRALNQIEKTLAGDHPGLEPLFGIFTRLTSHEAMPVTERLSPQPQRWRGRTRRWRGQKWPAMVTLAGLATVIGVLVGISLLLPSPQACPSGAVSQVARVRSISAARPPACPSQAAKPGSTSQSEP